MVALLRILIALGLFKGLWELLSSGRTSLISSKSNCNEDFLVFNENLNIPKYKLKNLKRARKTLQRIIKDYFREHPDFSIPHFATQGSYVSGTIIRNEQDLCDFDVGVYFFTKPHVRYETIQNHIKKALTGHTTAGIKLMSKCIRLNYKGDFHIDMPIYYTLDRKKFFLGSKGNNWQICDSKHFKDWVKENTQDLPQAIRIVRYCKAWADLYRQKRKIKMPSGLVFTIWAIQYYESNERDDVAFVHTAARILKYLKDNFQSSWSCNMPVAPFDNVLNKLNTNQQANFYKALEEVVKAGTEALGKEEKESAQKIWKGVFGKRFGN